MRYRKMKNENEGFYNKVGLKEDKRDYIQIKDRKEMERRVDCEYMEGIVEDKRIEEDEEYEVENDIE